MRLLLGLMVLMVGAATPALADPAATSRGAYTRGQGGTADDALAINVRARLGHDRLLKRSKILVKSVNGVVTLAGSVSSDAAHAESLDVTRNTPGVKAVTDDLRIATRSPDAPLPP
jgi:osmotically-inducible protein OsmY